MATDTVSIQRDSIPHAAKPSRLRRWAAHDANLWLTVAGLAYVLLFLVFFPQSYTSMDEASYMSTAYALRHGTVYPDVAGIRDVISYPMHGHMISKYPLGMPLLLALMSLFGWKAALATNLVVHLATFYVVILLLRRLQIPAVFALLYLLHPTAVIYSRTVMADPASGLLLAWAFYSLLCRRDVLCGALVGLSVVLRAGNIVALPLLLGSCLLDRSTTGDSNSALQTRLWTAGRILLGTLVPTALAEYYALEMQGGVSKYGGSFALSYFPHMFLSYAVALMLIYPGMLLAPLLYRGPGRMTLGTLCYGFLLMYCFWYYQDQGSSAAETLIIGQRFLLVVLPLFVVAYSAVAWRWLVNWNPRLRLSLGLCAVVVMSLLTIGISSRHVAYLSRLAQVRTSLLQADSPQDVLFCNMQLAKLFHPAWGTRRYWVTSADVYSAGLTLTEDRLSTVLAQPHHAVFLALWTRDYRAEANDERRLMADIQKAYLTRPLTAQERHGLPDDVKIIRILAMKPSSHLIKKR